MSCAGLGGAGRPQVRRDREHLDIHDPIFTFAVVFSAVLLVPILFRKLRLPNIVGLILAGVVLGPHAINMKVDSTPSSLLHPEQSIHPNNSTIPV